MKIQRFAAILTVLAALGFGLQDTEMMEYIMAKKPTKEETDKPERSAFKVKGADVVITRLGDRETLQIEGRVVEFFQTEEGYLLKRDVFHHPAKSLREAVERYLESEAAQ
jgi:hypothetical protein